MVIVALAELDELLAGRPPLPPRLGALLARAEQRPLNPACWLSELVTGRAVPTAPLTRLIDAPNDCAGTWLRADPVMLRPDLNAVWIAPGGSLAPEGEVAQALVDCIADEGQDFDLPHPERGYLRLEHLPESRFVPPGEVRGESLDYVLPTGPDQQRWRWLLNECQVLLHQYRERDDGPSPGSLWFWGAGQLPSAATIRPRIRRLVGSDPVLNGLAAWLKLDQTEPDAGQQTAADDLLLEWTVDRSLDDAANLARLEDWLGPLWQRLRLGRLDAIELAGPRRAWRLTPGAAWRVWQRPLKTPVLQRPA